MADPMLPVVLAQALTTDLRLRNEKTVDLVEQEDGEIREVVTTRHVNAEPGEIIDVTGWAHINAYVERGQIMLLTQTQITEVLETLVPFEEARLAAMEAEVTADAGTESTTANKGRQTRKAVA
jgi:hypothetical protein